MSNLLCRLLRGLGVIAACVAGFAGSPGIAFAQGNLATLPGLTVVQKPTAVAVNEACVQFAPNGYTPNPNGTPTERLFYTCRVMVQTANQLAGTGPVAASLGIPNEELRTGVQAIAPIQMNAQKQVGVEATKISVVGTRLLDLRGGARGFTISNNGVSAPVQSAAAGEYGLAGATGGGAAADTLDGKLGGFLNLAYNWGDVDQTSYQDAYNFRNFSLLLGVDYRVSDVFVLGGAFSYSDTHSSFDQSLGKVDATTYGIAGYGTYYVNEWFVDGFVAYGSVDYDSVRNISIPSNNPAIPAINTAATSSPKGDQWSASLGFGRSFDYAPVSITPTARLSYIWVKNKSFTEDEPINGVGLAVDSRTVRSLQSSLGVKISGVVNTSAGVFTPYASLQWVHEFENDNPSIVTKYVNDPFNTVFVIPTAEPTRDYGVLSIGGSAVFKDNWSGFAQFTTALGLDDITNYGFVIGLRKQF